MSERTIVTYRGIPQWLDPADGTLRVAPGRPRATIFTSSSDLWGAIARTLERDRRIHGDVRGLPSPVIWRLEESEAIGEASE